MYNLSKDDIDELDEAASKFNVPILVYNLTRRAAYVNALIDPAKGAAMAKYLTDTYIKGNGRGLRHTLRRAANESV